MVLPRQQVLNHALEIARELAEKPRQSLVALKDHMTSEIRNELSHFIDREIEMHAQTFHHPEVKERIMTRFGK